MLINNKSYNHKIITLLVTIVILIAVDQVSYAQSDTDTVVPKPNTSKAILMGAPLYFTMSNYRILPSYQIKIPTRTIMALPPFYSFSHLPSYSISGYIHTSHISGYTDPVAILAEVLFNSTLYLIEQKKHRKKDPRYWQRFWSP